MSPRWSRSSATRSNSPVVTSTRLDLGGRRALRIRRSVVNVTGIMTDGQTPVNRVTDAFSTVSGQLVELDSLPARPVASGGRRSYTPFGMSEPPEGAILTRFRSVRLPLHHRLGPLIL